MMAALAQLKNRLKERPGMEVIHQTGIQDETEVRKAYAAAGIRATVQAFFNNMAEHYQQADLIVCRAGASTVAEITVIGKAAIFIPFPFAADDHQTKMPWHWSGPAPRK